MNVINYEYSFRGFTISPHMMGAIRRYINDRLPPGDFLTGIITNDLRRATLHADDTNIGNIPAFVAYFYNEAPSQCWGSQQNMDRWMSEQS